MVFAYFKDMHSFQLNMNWSLDFAIFYTFTRKGMKISIRCKKISSKVIAEYINKNVGTTFFVDHMWFGNKKDIFKSDKCFNFRSEPRLRWMIVWAESGTTKKSKLLLFKKEKKHFEQFFMGLNENIVHLHNHLLGFTFFRLLVWYVWIYQKWILVEFGSSSSSSKYLESHKNGFRMHLSLFDFSAVFIERIMLQIHLGLISTQYDIIMAKLCIFTVGKKPWPWKIIWRTTTES